MKFTKDDFEYEILRYNRTRTIIGIVGIIAMSSPIFMPDCWVETIDKYVFGYFTEETISCEIKGNQSIPDSMNVKDTIYKHNPNVSSYRSLH